MEKKKTKLKKEHVESLIWIVGLVTEFILIILMSVFNFNLGFVSTLIWAILFLSLAILYFATRDHELLGLLFTGYGLLLITVLFKIVTKKIFIITMISWSALCGLIYLFAVCAVLSTLWKKLTGRDDYGLKVKAEEKLEREKKESTGGEKE